MNYERSDRFDYYLGQAVAQSCGGVADYYESIDTSGVRISSRLDRLVYRLIRRRERAKTPTRSWSVPRRIVSCVVIALAILMALTLSIAAMGGNLWNAVVDWYEDHFSLHLGESSSPPATLPPARIPTILAPRYIKEARKPAALPDGWSDQVLEANRYWVEVHFLRNGFSIGHFTQQVVRFANGKPSGSGYEHYIVKVKGYSGDAYFFKDGSRTLQWTDSQYNYSMTVYHEALPLLEMIAMAESLEAIDGPPPIILDERGPSGMLREVKKNRLSTTEYSIVTEYIDVKTERRLATFYQDVLRNGQYDMSVGKAKIYEVAVGDYIGLACCYYGDEIDYLYWTDGEYMYCLANSMLPESELIEWAKSVKPLRGETQMDTVYMPQNLPADLEELVWLKNSTCIEADYSRNGEIVFAYTQEVFSRSRGEDKREHSVKVVKIHHHYGYAQFFTDGSITLIWNNEQYRFILESRVMTIEELVTIARDIAPPEEIVEVRGPSGLSDEIIPTVVVQSEETIVTEYSHGDMLVGRFMQTLRWNDSAEYDPGCDMLDVTVNGHDGVLLTYPDGRRTVIWHDGSYRYHLESGCMTKDVILAWANSVTTVPADKEEPLYRTPPTVIEEERKPQKLTGGMREQSSVKTDEDMTVYYCIGDDEVAVFIQRIIDEYSGLGEDVYRNAQNLAFNQYGMLMLTTQDGTRILFWTDGEYYYELQSEVLRFEDMVACAQSMME